MVPGHAVPGARPEIAPGYLVPELHDHVRGVADRLTLVSVIPYGPPAQGPGCLRVLRGSVEHPALHEWRKDSGDLAVRGGLGEVKGHSEIISWVTGGTSVADIPGRWLDQLAFRWQLISEGSPGQDAWRHRQVARWHGFPELSYIRTGIHYIDHHLSLQTTRTFRDLVATTPPVYEKSLMTWAFVKNQRS